jgi:hypothetical protein
MASYSFCYSGQSAKQGSPVQALTVVQRVRLAVAGQALQGQRWALAGWPEASPVQVLPVAQGTRLTVAGQALQGQRWDWTG